MPASVDDVSDPVGSAEGDAIPTPAPTPTPTPAPSPAPVTADDRSAAPPRRYDLEFASIPAVVERNAARWPELEAIVDGDRRWTMAELAARMHDAIRGFVAAGVARGDRVALWAPNSADWIVAALGVLGAGGILVPVNTRFRGDEAAYVLRASGARVLVTVNGFLGTDYPGLLRAADPACPALGQVVILDGVATDGALSWARFVAAGSSVDPGTSADRLAAVGPDDISDIMFTSGTTGRPKGVVLTHGQSLRAYGWLTEVFTFRRGDRYLVVPPFFHTFGYKAGWLASLIHGVTVLPLAVFDAGAVLRLIESERISILLGPPTLFAGLIAHPERSRRDHSSLRVTVPSATIVPVELVHQLRAELGFEVVLTAYGLTEATSLCSTCHPGDAPDDVAGSVGRAALDIELRVVAVPDEAGAAGATGSGGSGGSGGGRAVDVPAGQPGEVLVRGYNVMRGYWEDPAATAQVIDAEGWLHTGDLGILDERGFLHIIDRLKDILVVGGFNVSSAEVERVLLTHPGIAAAAVVGVPDKRLDEVAAAFLVAAPGAVLDADEIRAWARDHLANYKAPRYVHIVDALPLNASMKVLKAELRARARAALTDAP